MKSIKTLFSVALAGVVLTLGSAAPAIAADAAADFPSRPLRFILPLGPGSSSEVASRFIAERMSAILGQPAVAENRPGGEMQIALQALFSAPADGHTIMMLSPSPMVVNPLTVENWPYDVQRDIRPLAQSTVATPAYVVAADSKYRTLQDLIDAARAKPGAVSVANYSRNYQGAVAALEREAGVQFTHVPYKGAAQALTDTVGGSLDAALIDMAGVMPLAREGRIRALAVTSKERNKALPDTPTLREAGYKDSDLAVWIGYGIRAETPEPIARKLEETMLTVLRSPEFAEFNEKSGHTEIVARSGAELAKQISEETERFKQVLKR